MLHNKEAERIVLVCHSIVIKEYNYYVITNKLDTKILKNLVLRINGYNSMDNHSAIETKLWEEMVKD